MFLYFIIVLHFIVYKKIMFIIIIFAFDFLGETFCKRTLYGLKYLALCFCFIFIEIVFILMIDLLVNFIISRYFFLFL